LNAHPARPGTLAGAQGEYDVIDRWPFKSEKAQATVADYKAKKAGIK